MTAAGPRRGFDWEAAARELGESLDAYHSLVIIGVDPVVTGRAAVGIARAQSARRRVAVGDLFAESPPIQELVHGDDPHGLVDSFLYGVSLSRIAHEVAGAGQLFVMPSGTEPPTYEEILPNPRWHRLSAGFREVGALLILAVPASAPNIADLVAATDGAILVGEGVPATLPVTTVITSLREPRPEQAAPPAASPAQIINGPANPWRRTRRFKTTRVAGIAAAAMLAGLWLWLAYRPLASFHRRIGPAPDTMKGIGAVVPAITPETAVKRDSQPAATEAPPLPTVTAPPIRNPADSGQAAAFAVELMAANTQAGAILKLQQDGKNLPAATFAPVFDSQGSRWFKVIGGAYVDRADADSLLASLRRRKVLAPGSGSVVRLPFAFRVDSAVPAAAVPGMVASYADQGLPVYALRQADGTAWLLVGAFESLDQSELYAESLRASRIVPMLVYRKGRTF